MMLSSTAKILSSAALFSSLSYAQTFGASSSVSNVSSSACPQMGGAHIIVARASLEAPGYGIIGVVKDEILKQVPGSNAEFVDYPATLDNYFVSESDGVVGMRKLINAYVDKCPSNLPLVIMGYSQGAQVTADSLVGQVDSAFPDNSTIDKPLPASTLSRVAAVVMMGDPTALANQSFHVGNATKNSLFARKDESNFQITGLASRTRSYCDFNDPYCASGNLSTGLSVHIGYVQEYGKQAEDFVVKQIKAFYANNGTMSSSNGTSTGGSGTSSTSATPAAYTGSASNVRGLDKVVLVLCAGLLAWIL